MSLMPVFGARRSNFYDPFSQVDAWDDPFKNFHSGSVVIAPHSPHHQATNSSFANAPIEWKQTPEAHFFKTRLPGVRREDVKVEVEDDEVLKISGERIIEKEDRHDNWHHVERSRGKFLTAFKLPEDARADQIKSSMDHDGVLTVKVPKWEANHHHHHHVRAVEITG